MTSGRDRAAVLKRRRHVQTDGQGGRVYHQRMIARRLKRAWDIRE